ncbi:hypothetical protein D3C86_1268520 [compost metagenome]
MSRGHTTDTLSGSSARAARYRSRTWLLRPWTWSSLGWMRTTRWRSGRLRNQAMVAATQSIMSGKAPFHSAMEASDWEVVNSETTLRSGAIRSLLRIRARGCGGGEKACQASCSP